MKDLNTTILLVTLKVNCVNILIEKQQIFRLNKTVQLYAAYRKHSVQMG